MSAAVSILGRIALILFALAVLMVGAGLIYRAYRQHRNAEASSIHTPHGIDESMFVRIGGLDQWITIRGEDRSNPVLLILDGGPGFASSPFIPSAHEKDFVVVTWDQPGSGKTYGRAGRIIDPTLDIESMSQDGIEVANYVRGRLQQRQIGILAESWGTILGIHMVKSRPDFFYAYVGAGQIVDMPRGKALSYQRVLSKAHADGDHRAIRDLETSGPPPYASMSALRTQRKWAATYERGAPRPSTIAWSVFFAPRYSLNDFRNWMSGFIASQDHFFGKLMTGSFVSADLRTLGPEFGVPIFFFQGVEDDYTLFASASAYMDTINAPQKMIIPVAGAGHLATVSHAPELHGFLLERVRPLAVSR